MNRRLGLSIAISMALVTLAGCGSTASVNTTAQGSSNTAKQTSNQNQQIHISFWTIGLKSHFGNYINGMIKTYEASHPGVVIDWQDVPGTQIVDKYLAAVASGNPPDVANMYNIAQLVSKGAVLDMTPYLTQQEKDQYIPSFLNAFNINGHYYAVPWYAGTSQLVYSQKIMQQAGISTPPTTLQEELQDGAIIHQKTGKYGFEPVLAGNKNWILSQMVADGIPLLSSDRKKAAFDTPAAISLLKELKKGYDDGAITPDSVNASLNDGTQEFLQGQAAFFNGGPWIFDRSTPSVVKSLGWTVSAGIKGSVGYQGNTQEIIVSKASKHPKQAVDFATFVTNSANELAFCKLVAIYPSTKAATKASYFTTTTPKTSTQKYQEMGAKQLADTVLTPWSAPPVVQWDQLDRDFGQKISAVFTSNASIPQTLKNIQNDWNSILQGGQ